MKYRIKKQTGTAIIVALFVTALVAAAAIAMMTRFAINVRRTELVLNYNQANLYAQGSVDWAINQLIHNWQQKQPGKLTDTLPIQSPVNVMNGVKIQSVIYDEQGKLNLNNLNNADFQALFVRLLRMTDTRLDQANAQAIEQGVLDWITPGINNSPFDQRYAKLNPPYRSAHQPMVSISELRMVQGVTPELFNKLSPFITALPEKTTLNLNSMDMPLLMSLSPAITLELAQSLIAYRKQTPFVDLDHLANFAVVKNSPIAQNNLTVTSSYFLVATEVTQGEQQMTLYTLLTRILKDSKPIVVTLWQSKGTL